MSPSNLTCTPGLGPLRAFPTSTYGGTACDGVHADAALCHVAQHFQGLRPPQPFSQALTAALHVIASIRMLLAAMRLKLSKAWAHSRPFSHALTRALHVTVLVRMLLRPMWINTSKACVHSQPFSQTLMAALHAMVSI